MLNQVDVRLAGTTRTMKATFSAIAGIERDLGKSIIRFMDDVQVGDISFTAVALVIFHGLKGNDDTRLTLEQIGDAVVEAGITSDDALSPSLAAVKLLGVALKGVGGGKPEKAAGE